MKSPWKAVRSLEPGRDYLAFASDIPVRKQYATLSVWVDDEALAAFSRARPHGELMKELSAAMAPTTFVRWTISGADGRPTWREALRRLAEAGVS